MKRSRSEPPSPATTDGFAPHRRWAFGSIAALMGLSSFPAGAVAQQGLPSHDFPIEGSVAPSGVAECCGTLLIPVGARAVGAGRTLGSQISPDAVFSNPAGLAGLDGRHFIVHHADIGAPLLAFTLLFTPEAVGTLGISYRLIDFGDDLATDEEGNVLGRLTTRDHLLAASFATPVVWGLSAGVNYKLVRFRIGCSGFCHGFDLKATTQAVDVGIQLRDRFVEDLALGLAITDLGLPLQVINAEQADPPPTRVRLGGSYEVLRHFAADTAFDLRLSAEMAWSPRGSVPATPSFGAELALEEFVTLRAGYVFGEGIGTGPAVGVSLTFGSFTLGVARAFRQALAGSDAEPLDVTFGTLF